MTDHTPPREQRQWAKETCLAAIDEVIEGQTGNWSLEEENAVMAQRDRVARFLGLPTLYEGRTF